MDSDNGRQVRLFGVDIINEIPHVEEAVSTEPQLPGPAPYVLIDLESSDDEEMDHEEVIVLESSEDEEVIVLEPPEDEEPDNEEVIGLEPPENEEPYNEEVIGLVPPENEEPYNEEVIGLVPPEDEEPYNEEVIGLEPPEDEELHNEEVFGWEPPEDEELDNEEVIGLEPPEDEELDFEEVIVLSRTAFEEVLGSRTDENRSEANYHESGETLASNQRTICDANMQLAGQPGPSMPEPVAPLPPPRAPFDCPICMGPYVEEVTTKCGHVFCENCIRNAISVQSSCPTCRRKITYRDLMRIYLPSGN